MQRRSLAIVLAAALCGAACVEDPSALSDDPIPFTRAEAEIMGIGAFRDALEARVKADLDSATMSPAGAGVPVTIGDSATATVNCELGGSIDALVALTGTVDEDAGTGNLTFRMVLDPKDCVSENQGLRYTQNGWPDVTVRFDFDVHDGHIDMTGSLTGGLRIARGTSRRSAICVMDIHLTGSDPGEEPGTFHLTGTMCGAPVDEIVTAEL